MWIEEEKRIRKKGEKKKKKVFFSSLGRRKANKTKSNLLHHPYILEALALALQVKYLHYQWHPQHKYQPNLSNVWWSIYWEKKQTKYIDSSLNIRKNRHQMILGERKKEKTENLASSSSPTAPVKSTTKEPKSSTALSPLVPSPAWDCTFVKKENLHTKLKYMNMKKVEEKLSLCQTK